MLAQQEAKDNDFDDICPLSCKTVKRVLLVSRYRTAMPVLQEGTAPPFPAHDPLGCSFTSGLNKLSNPPHMREPSGSLPAGRVQYCSTQQLCFPGSANTPLPAPPPTPPQLFCYPHQPEGEERQQKIDSISPGGSSQAGSFPLRLTQTLLMLITAVAVGGVGVFFKSCGFDSKTKVVVVVFLPNASWLLSLLFWVNRVVSNVGGTYLRGCRPTPRGR